MNHVQQPTGNSCMSACIAMITGLGINEVMSQFHGGYMSRPMNQCHLIDKYLISHKFVPFGVEELSDNLSVEFTSEYYYIVAVPSLSDDHSYHAVVIYFSDGRLEVLDPMYGKGKSYCFGVYANNDNLIDISDIDIEFDIAIKSNNH